MFLPFAFFTKRVIRSAVTSSSQKLLDTVGGAYFAVSLRKLSSSYTGSAIRVKRISDSAELDIGFDANGNLNLSAINTFLSNGSGSVSRWYDQSGNNRHLTNDYQPQEPLINPNGSWKFNIPPLDFDGNDDQLFTVASTTFNSGASSTYAVYGVQDWSAFTSLTNYGLLYEITVSDVSGTGLYGYTTGDYNDWKAGQGQSFGNGYNTGQYPRVFGKYGTMTGYNLQPVLIDSILSTNSASYSVNGIDISSGSHTGTIPSITDLIYVGGSNASGDYLKGAIWELVVYPTDHNSTTQTTVRNNITSYFTSSVGVNILGTSPVVVMGGTPVVLTASYTGMDPDTTTFLWEASNQSPEVGQYFTLNPAVAGPQWYELEVDTIDGKRLYATGSYTAQSPVTNTIENYNVVSNSAVRSWYKLDGTLADSMGTSSTATFNGNAKFDATTYTWLNRPTGQSVVVNGNPDYVRELFSASLFPVSVNSISVEGMFYVSSFEPNGVGNGNLFRIYKNDNQYFELYQNIWDGIYVRTNTGTMLDTTQTAAAIPLNSWFQMKLSIDNNGHYFIINGTQIASQSVANNMANWRTTNLEVKMGQFYGWVDELVLKVT